MIEHERDLFVHALRELYHIERELEELQAELAESATREEIEEFYAAHSEATADQIDRLEPIFDAIEAEVEPGTIDNTALDGLREEREELLEDVEDPTLADLVELEFGRSIERLEITKLETLLTLADRMNLPQEVIDPLEQTRDEAEDGLERLQEFTQ